MSFNWHLVATFPKVWNSPFLLTGIAPECTISFSTSPNCCCLCLLFAFLCAHQELIWAFALCWQSCVVFITHTCGNSWSRQVWCLAKVLPIRKNTVCFLKYYYINIYRCEVQSSAGLNLWWPFALLFIYFTSWPNYSELRITFPLLCGRHLTVCANESWWYISNHKIRDLLVCSEKMDVRKLPAPEFGQNWDAGQWQTHQVVQMMVTLDNCVISQSKCQQPWYYFWFSPFFQSARQWNYQDRFLPPAQYSYN